MAPRVDLTAHPPPASARIPKLKYRNPLPADQISVSSRDSHDTGASSTSAQDRSATPDTAIASSSSRPSYETANLTSPSLASLSLSASSSNGSGSSSSKKKKKSSSVFGFLTLKEPSQLALEQFAQASRQPIPAKGTSSSSSRHSSIQSNPYEGQKLPSNVPKVNSKWDGVPDSVKPAKSRNSVSTSTSSSTKSERNSWSARASLSSRHGNQVAPWNESQVSVVTTETRNPPNSIASAANSTVQFSSHARDVSRESRTSGTSAVSYYSPHVPMVSGALPVESSTTESEPRLSASTFDGRSSIESSFDFRADSPASSADSVDTVVRDTADNIFRKLNDQPQPNVWGEPSPSANICDDKLVPDSHDFLFNEQPIAQPAKNDSPMTSPTVSSFSPTVEHYVPPRPMQNFSRPMAPRKAAPPSMPPTTRYRITPASSGLPTLYEASLASTESLATVQLGQDQQDEQEEHDNDNDDAQSIAPSTIAPSVLSTHWYESPRERLGLGGRLRMSNDLSPWDNGESLGKPRKNRLSMFGIGTSKA